MNKYSAARTDIKLIIREPILMLFILIPLLIMVVFKIMILKLLPFITDLTDFGFEGYYGYILTFYFLLTPGMVGTAAGFLMIDERDNKIYDLMSVTPVGYSGYIFNRLMMPLAASILYAILGHYVLNIINISIPMLIYIAILTGVEGIIISLMLFAFAEDKVQGLTYSKALSLFSTTVFADLLGMRWVSILAALCPFYWLIRMVYFQGNIIDIFCAAAVHVVWLGIMFAKLQNL